MTCALIVMIGTACDAGDHPCLALPAVVGRRGCDLLPPVGETHVFMVSPVGEAFCVLFFFRSGLLLGGFFVIRLDSDLI